jgi:hypothetical protein
LQIPPDRIKKNNRVDVWDLGPQVAPRPPAAPEEPEKSKLKGSELAAAEVAYEDDCERYRDELRAWNAAKKTHREWIDRIGGPVKIELWAVDARMAMDIEPDRYVLDLPHGAKPGKAQRENEQREAAEIDRLKRAASLDPLHAGAIR